MNNKGVSLMEILVVITVFAVLTLLASRGIYLTLRGSRKSEAVTKVRENLDYSFAVMERNLRNAKSASCISATRVDYEDKDYIPSYFSCEGVGSGGYVSSASARLTSDFVDITSCSFVCELEGNGVPASVSISITGEDAQAAGAEAGEVSVSTKIFLRNY